MDDFPGHVQSLGLSPELGVCQTLQCTPMRHRDVHVGTFFVGDKEGGEVFTGEDEELLVLLASQAAAAFVNARAHNDERRARAGLEALVEASPVGVVVFDAGTRMPAIVNLEARRIVEVLGGPGCSAMDLLGEFTSQLSDGRKVTVDDLMTGKTVSDIEVELSVLEGGSIRMLVNTAPIHSDTDNVEAVLVSMQDLATLVEFERMRLEFLTMVSHELRAPLTSIKGSTTSLLTTFNRAEIRQFIRIIDQGANHMEGLIHDLLDAGRIHAGTLSVDPEAVEVATLVEQARTTFMSGGRRQIVPIDLPPDLPRVSADERRIVKVLNNLLSNAARHSPQSSPIVAAAVRDGIVGTNTLRVEMHVKGVAF